MIDKEMIDKLITQLVPSEAGNWSFEKELPESLDENLRYFLSVCPGGYTKDGYLHFWGATGPVGRDLISWNAPNLWKQYYGLSSDWLFFAEDAFGNQFGFDFRDPQHRIFMLWVDDGKIEDFADTLEFFIEFTVYDFEIHGQMRKLSEQFYVHAGKRLAPFQHISYKRPILLGGNESDVKNLEFSDSKDHLMFIGQVVSQVKKLPIGTRVKDVIVDANEKKITLVPED